MKRYVLLRDNKIIDTTKYEIEPERSFGYYSYFYKKDNYELDFMAKDADIVKESDNLIDLIEVGDLVVEKEREFKAPFAVESIVDDAIYLNKTSDYIVERERVACYSEGIKIENVLKIYKPNQNRGYDLAWERD